VWDYGDQKKQAGKHSVKSNGQAGVKLESLAKAVVERAAKNGPVEDSKINNTDREPRRLSVARMRPGLRPDR